MIRFGNFEMDTESLELKRDGQRLHLQIQPFRVLQTLVANAGSAVTREELRRRVWPTNVFLDFDHGLNNAVARLREALGDSSDHPEYIETLPRVGYRFIYPLEAAPVAAARTLPAPEARSTASDRPGRRLLAGGAASLAAVLLAFLVHDDLPRSTSAIRSIAVLPFRDLTGETGQEYFAEGLTEALVTRLAQNRGLRVVSRQSAERARDRSDSVEDMATELGVDGIIDSSFVRSGDDIRIDVRLVRVADDSHAWARSYLRRLDNLFALQVDIANDIAVEIAAEIDLPKNSDSFPALTGSIEAYELYLHGRHLFAKRNPEAVARSIEYFRQAIDIDPHFAAAWAGIAESYATLGGSTLVQSIPASDVRDAALAAARRALELEPRLAEAHSALGQVLHKLYPRDESRDASIESAYRTALALSPGYVNARHWYANFLSSRRRSEEAIAMYREALLLDPMNANVMSRLGLEIFNTGQVSEGLHLMQKTIEIEPWQLNAHLRLGWSLAALGRLDEARQAFETADRISADNPHARSGLAYVDALGGDRESAERELDRLRPKAESIGAPFLVAIVYVGLRDRDNALLWLERAAGTTEMLGRAGLYGLESSVYDWLREDDRFDSIRLAAYSGQLDSTC